MRRMRLTLRLLLKSLLLLAGVHSFAQTNPCKPPIGRVLWHDRIDREQKNAAKAFQGNQSEEVRYYVTQTLTKRVDYLQCKIETDSSLGNQKKKAYLSGVEKMVRNFYAWMRNRQFTASHFPTAIEAYEVAIEKDKKKETIERIVEQHPYDVGMLLLSSEAFINNPGYRTSKNSLLLKYCRLFPDQIFTKLKENPDVPFRDSLIKLAGYNNPKRLYDYAS